MDRKLISERAFRNEQLFLRPLSEIKLNNNYARAKAWNWDPDVGQDQC